MSVQNSSTSRGDSGAPADCEIGGRRLMRYEDFVRQVKPEQPAPVPRPQPETESRLARQIREEAAREAQRERERVARELAAPAPKVTDELLDHNYDGIQEYDNPTPGWWWMVLWGCVVFAVLYTFVYHFSPVVSPVSERHARAEEHMLAVRFAELSGFEMGEEKILRIMGQPAWLEQGRTVFETSACITCHGNNGEGLVGPNLTDEYFKNASTLMGIVDVLNDGAANGAMPAQRNVLNPNEIALVAAYVASLRGENLEGPKGPEGEQISAWPAPIRGDAPAAAGGGG